MRMTRIILVILGLAALFSNALAYEVGTHAFLTKGILEFYNENFLKKQIPDEFLKLVIDGSRSEDDNPRWMNHFYDPVYNRGLTAIPGNWLSSKEWARRSDYQTFALYNPVMNTTIAGLLAVSNPAALETTDYTWERAIKDYVRGDKKRAFRGLGQILHLIEDASVPDHTRNDPHPAFDKKDTLETGSPYELWTGNFNLENPDSNLKSRLANKTPVLLENLDEYFDRMANYSNNNFYSKDTIGIGEYKSPEPDYFSIDLSDGFFYGFKADREFGDYKLLKSLPTFLTIKNKEDLFGTPVVMQDYWSRLSVKAVQYGAGVIDLFFKEVEKAKNDPNFVKSEPRSMLAQVAETVGNFFNQFLRKETNKSGLALVAEIPLEKKPNRVLDQFGEVRPPREVEPPKVASTLVERIINRILDDNQDEDEAERLANAKKIPNSQLPIFNETSKTGNASLASVSSMSAGFSGAGQGEATFRQCEYSAGGTPTRQKLLINEVAWMGGSASANDEWFELKNISGGTLDISGWQVLDKSEQIKITFSNGTKLVADGFMLLERTDDDSVPSVTADLVYVGALSNTDEGLRLFDKNCVLMDEVVASFDWLAGESETRKTMERGSTGSPQADLSWHTSATVGGTPKASNSQQTQPSPEASAGEATNHLVISEVQITGGTGKTNNDFVELYNSNNTAVNLNGYRLVKRTKTGTTDTSIKSWTSDVFISAKGYYLWANSDYLEIPTAPDVTTSATLASDNGVALRQGAENTGTIVDSVAWGGAENNFVETRIFPENLVANQSISRSVENDTNNNAVDFVKSKPTPKNSSTSGGFLSPEFWTTSATAPANHLVISEVYPDRTGANQDFVELYNPNATGTIDIDISGWSLQVLSANATSTEKIAKKNFVAGNKIPARGFFLIGIDDYPAADMNWASGSLNSTSGATIFLVNGTTTISDLEDSRIVDQIAYGAGSGILAPEVQAVALPAVGQSWERKSLEGGVCKSAHSLTSSPQGGEFLGNGCDTDNNASDFEIRSAPKPQSSANLLEPREALPAPENFSAQSDQTNLNIILNWNNAVPAPQYILNYGTTSLEIVKPFAEIVGTTTYSFQSKEVGVNYYFSIIAKDSEGLTSAAATTTLNSPSLFNNFYFYKDTRSTTSKKYLFDFYYDSYPFIPDVYNKGTGRILVFYLNKEAPIELELNTTNNFQPENLENVLDITYGRCAGGSISPGFSLILPGACGNGGGVENLTLETKYVEDLHLLVELATTTDSVNFTNQDFVTVGMYSFYDSGGGSQRYRLVALDKIKYYFQTNEPTHQAPLFNPSTTLAVDFNSSQSNLTIGWPAATDSDTLDSRLVYEINYATSSEFFADSWILVGSGLSHQKIVSPGDNFMIGVRAKDDFGNLSGVITTSWSYPETTYYITQDQTNGWSASFGTKNQNCPSCPDSASLQSIQSLEDFVFDKVVLRLRQAEVSDTANLRLSIYAESSSWPDFNQLLDQSQLTSIINPDSNTDITFTFSSPISLLAGTGYWLVLDVESYSDTRGFYRNSWQNAVNIGTNWYSDGQAGKGTAGTCDGYCSFTIPYPDATADWYMKIGLAP